MASGRSGGSSGGGGMTRTRSMGAMSAEEDLLNEIKRLTEKLRVSDKACLELKKHLQEAKRREQQLKADQLILMHRQKKLEKLNKGSGKSWKRRSKDTSSGSGISAHRDDHAEEIREALKLSKLSLSSNSNNNPSGGSGAGASSSSSSNTSPLASSSGGLGHRKQSKPSLNTYEEGVGGGRKRRDSASKITSSSSSRYDAIDDDEDDDDGTFDPVFSNNFDLDDYLGDVYVEDDDEYDEYEYDDDDDATTTGVTGGSSSSSASQSSSSSTLKSPLRQYSSPDKVSSGRKIKRTQKTHSVPVLFSNSPEMTMSTTNANAHANMTTSGGQEEAKRYFEKFELDWNQTLLDACAKGNAELVSKLLREPSTVAINTSLMKGKNLLSVAFKNTHSSSSDSWLDVVAILLSAGALVDETDRQGNTALHLAMLHPQPTSMDRLYQIVDVIIHKSNTIDAKNSIGNTALLMAVHNCCGATTTEARECYKNIILSLLNRGANVNIKNKYKDSPLLWAAKSGAHDIVELCLNNGETNLDIKDMSGNTPLILAAQNGYKDICELLVKKGANITATNSFGKNSLDVAKDNQIRKLLEDYNPALKSWKWFVDLSHVEFRKDKEEILGEGKFSKCILGKLYGTYVAVKKFRRETSNVKQFQDEVGLMSDIRHPNIVLFLGACYQENYLCIITEYLKKGSLRQFLRSCAFTEQELPRDLIVKLACSTARGMAWLHSRDPVVLHRDLHAKNILLTDSLECKVADFGLSQIEIPINRVGDNMFYKRIHPPEVSKGYFYTTASDIYQYGTVLYEMLFLGKKAPSKPDFEQLQHRTHPEILELTKRCCKEMVVDRPASFLEIIEILEGIPPQDATSSSLYSPSPSASSIDLLENHNINDTRNLTEEDERLISSVTNGVLDEGYIG
eukprot:TRINITY_DN3146_c0_g1_i1.p1 TRINITY_DN3146_c0_g1~~TRINITY_DN3146_c0_g1_i1.p1  ORF type:complete len:906 (-),score=262.69 TRINITY_DN3146_c0_g1_i1:327-3044(-)